MSTLQLVKSNEHYYPYTPLLGYFLDFFFFSRFCQTLSRSHVMSYFTRIEILNLYHWSQGVCELPSVMLHVCIVLFGVSGG